MEFKEVLQSRNEKILECKEYIEHIKNCFKNFDDSGTGSYILISLLNGKIDILKDLSYDNIKTTLTNLKEKDEQIYAQIEILRNEVIEDFKKDANKK
ncbi:MAG: hypothetical protein GX282_01620 [Campylobacteraceae bacterium]|nr:hypothetical protein [Campylobacteraceae bacterium]